MPILRAGLHAKRGIFIRAKMTLAEHQECFVLALRSETHGFRGGCSGSECTCSCSVLCEVIKFHDKDFRLFKQALGFSGP